MPCTILCGGEFCRQQFLVIVLVTNRNMLLDVSPQLAVGNADHHHWKRIVLMSEQGGFSFPEEPLQLKGRLFESMPIVFRSV